MRPPILVILLAAINFAAASEKQLPLTLPGDSTVTTSNTLPALPLARASNQSAACRLDLSNELFGGVANACIRGGLDRSRCCPVLAAWLFAAHARSALQVRTTSDHDDGPMMPDDNQKCVESLQSALARRGITLPRPNTTCDTVLCFCAIRLHQLGSLGCPAAFTVDSGGGSRRAAGRAVPTAAVRQLERNCCNASYAGCTRCLESLAKVTGQEVMLGGGNGEDERAAKMFARDCKLMGLTWLLAKNKTTYIPTVSAVLRAILYSGGHKGEADGDYGCSRDHEKMPLAVDALEFQHDYHSHAVSITASHLFLSFGAVLLLFLLGN